MIQPRYPDADSARSRLSGIGKWCVALTKAVSGIEPPKVPIDGAKLSEAIHTT
jgi:hypothetical protein